MELVSASSPREPVGDAEDTKGSGRSLVMTSARYPERLTAGGFAVPLRMTTRHVKCHDDSYPVTSPARLTPTQGKMWQGWPQNQVDRPVWEHPPSILAIVITWTLLYTAPALSASCQMPVTTMGPLTGRWYLYWTVLKLLSTRAPPSLTPRPLPLESGSRLHTPLRRIIRSQDADAPSLHSTPVPTLFYLLYYLF